MNKYITKSEPMHDFEVKILPLMAKKNLYELVLWCLGNTINDIYFYISVQWRLPSEYGRGHRFLFIFYFKYLYLLYF